MTLLPCDERLSCRATSTSKLFASIGNLEPPRLSNCRADFLGGQQNFPPVTKVRADGFDCFV